MSLKQKINTKIQAALTLGIDEDYEYVFARKIRIVNLYALNAARGWLIFTIINIYFFNIYPLILCIFGTSANIISLILNKNKKHNLARDLLAIANISGYIAIRYLYGPNSGIQYIILIWLLFITFLKEKDFKLILLYIIGASAFIYFEYNYATEIYERETLLKYLRLAVLSVSMLFMFSFIQFFKKDVTIYQEYVEQKNQMLEMQQEEIRTQNEKLEEQNEKIDSQKAHISKIFGEIKDSVNYASRIQRSILLPEEAINELLPKNFIIFQPKDIVSGDFYWIKEKGDNTFIAAIDCTGHGVPGAFMTAISNSLLNEIFTTSTSTNPGHMLDLLHVKLLETFNYGISKENTNDGLDIALCVYNTKNNTLRFAGAKRPLYLFRQGILEEIKGTKFSIGTTSVKFKSFHTTELTLKKNDRIYMFTDGYSDQFGSDMKKMKIKPFKEQLEQLQEIPFEEHKSQLIKAFGQWKGSNAQTDDILVLGFEI